MARPRKEQRNSDIVQKKKDGWTYRQISDYFNIGVRAVWEICDKYNKEHPESKIVEERKKKAC